jgi:hypothetical protein
MDGVDLRIGSGRREQTGEEVETSRPEGAG